MAPTAKPRVVERGPDDHGFHRSPRSSCCGAGVVWYRRDAGVFVALTSMTDLTVTLGRGLWVFANVRCGRCNADLNTWRDAAVGLSAAC